MASFRNGSVVGAVIASTVTTLLAIVTFAWYLSARLTSQDIRLSVIERQLKLDGYGKRDQRHSADLPGTYRPGT